MVNSLVSSLISEIESIVNQYKIEKEKNGESFNILEISGINTLEVKMCRILAEIINPKGSHNQGTSFLKSFVREVLRMEMFNDEIDKSSVFTEYQTDKHRRIDIVILTPKRFIPIEVKLYALDQQNQCADYYCYAKSKGDIKSKVFYLTIDGHLPYEHSGLTPVEQNGEIVGFEEVTAISFSDDVCRWLDNVINSINDKPLLKLNLLQVKNALEKLGGSMDKELNNRIANVISESSDSLRAALAISDCVNIAKENLMAKMFSAFEQSVSLLNYPLEKLNNKFYYKNEGNYLIHSFCSKKTSKICPAIPYRYKKLNAKKEIWFMIEVGNYGGLHCGFLTAKNGDDISKLCVSNDELKTHINIPFGFNKDEGWFYWEYLPLHDNDGLPDTSPDFKLSNEAFIKLFDDENFNEFIDRCMLRIKIILEEMIGQKKL